MVDCKNSYTPMEKGMKLSAKLDSKLINDSIFRQLMGSLICLTTTRPSLDFAISYISRFMTQSKVEQ